MKKSRFTDEQIVFALKQQSLECPLRKFAASWESANRLFIAGKRSLAKTGLPVCRLVHNLKAKKGGLCRKVCRLAVFRNRS